MFLHENMQFWNGFCAFYEGQAGQHKYSHSSNTERSTKIKTGRQTYRNGRAVLKDEDTIERESTVIQIQHTFSLVIIT
jgi:hypothetical protein